MTEYTIKQDKNGRNLYYRVTDGKQKKISRAEYESAMAEAETTEVETVETVETVEAESVETAETVEVESVEAETAEAESAESVETAEAESAESVEVENAEAENTETTEATAEEAVKAESKNTNAKKNRKSKLIGGLRQSRWVKVHEQGQSNYSEKDNVMDIRLGSNRCLAEATYTVHSFRKAAFWLLKYLECAEAEQIIALAAELIRAAAEKASREEDEVSADGESWNCRIEKMGDGTFKVHLEWAVEKAENVPETTVA